MSEPKLSATQKARIERNRQKALLLRSARLSNRPYPTRNKDIDGAKHNESDINTGSSNSNSGLSRVVDTGGGFLLDAEEQEELSRPPRNLVEDPGTLKTSI